MYFALYKCLFNKNTLILSIALLFNIIAFVIIAKYNKDSSIKKKQRKEKDAQRKKLAKRQVR